jgi:hypothetical protein
MAWQDGIFHHNIFLVLELMSPYFKSGQLFEDYQVGLSYRAQCTT